MSLKIYHLSELQKQVKLVENLFYPNKLVAQLPQFKVADSPDHTGNWVELWNQFLLTIQKNKSNYNSQTINLTPIFHTSIMNTDFILVIHIELFPLGHVPYNTRQKEYYKKPMGYWPTWLCFTQDRLSSEKKNQYWNSQLCSWAQKISGINFFRKDQVTRIQSSWRWVPTGYQPTFTNSLLKFYLTHTYDLSFTFT